MPKQQFYTFKLVQNTKLPITKGYIDDVSYTIIPVIMMKEGVHSGSAGPIFYSANELSKHHQAWNGKPVCLQHPTIDGVPVSCNTPEFYETVVLGTLFNTHFEDNALKADAWLKDTSISKIAPTLISDLEKGAAIDVSTGLFNDDIQTQGEWSGEKYNSVASDIKPDHLALLPGATGACSWEDGCGVRTNQGGEKKPMFFDQLMAYFRKKLPPSFVDNESSHSEIRKQLQELIDPQINDQEMSYIVDVYEDKFIYEIWSMESGEAKLYKQKYNKDSEDIIEFKDEPVPVKKKTTYEVFSAEELEEETTNPVIKNQEKEPGGEKMPCCPDKVAAFVANVSNPYTNDDVEWMNELTESALEGVIKAFPEKEQEIAVNEEEKPEVKMSTIEEVLANSTGEVAESIQYGIQAHAEKKQGLISAIKTNEKNQFSDEELNAFTVPFLTKLAGMVPGTTNFAANTGGDAPVTNTDTIEPMTDVYGEKEVN